MFEELLPYYNRELSFIRDSAASFAKTYPKIAARLRLGTDSSEDPHVERLIEAFAFLNARTRHKIEDDFPELTQSYLNALFPNYLRPVPSSAIIQLKLDKSQADQTEGVLIDRGTQLESLPISGEKCLFRTSYNTDLWPLKITHAGLYGKPFSAPTTPASRVAKAVIQIELQCYGQKIFMSDMSLSNLRLFLSGESAYTSQLYETLFTNTLAVALGFPDQEDPIAVFGKESLSPVGFESDEALYPWPVNTSESYRLLTEFFAFPQKFHFVDLHLKDFQTLPDKLSKLSVFIYLDKHLDDLEHSVDVNTFRTGCTPIVNLYHKRMEPFELTNREFEYRVIPSNPNPLSHEIYSIERVTLSNDTEEIPVHEFFSLNHTHESENQYFWKGTRRPATTNGDVPDKGTEIYINLVDLRDHSVESEELSIDIEATCLNRDLPGRLPFGGGEPRLKMSGLKVALDPVACLTPLTATLRPPTSHETLWRLISHLSVGQLSMIEDLPGAEAIREVLTLYDLKDTPETRELINSLQSVESRQVVGRLPDDTHGVVRGTEIVLQFSKENFSNKWLYLMSVLLERFFSIHCTINSFIRVKVRLEGDEELLELGPGRAGNRVFI